VKAGFILISICYALCTLPCAVNLVPYNSNLLPCTRRRTPLPLAFDLWPFCSTDPINSINPPILSSSIQYQATSIQHPAPSIQHPISNRLPVEIQNVNRPNQMIKLEIFPIKPCYYHLDIVSTCLTILNNQCNSKPAGDRTRE